MDKITSGVVVALVIGILLGYLGRSLFSPSPQISSTNETSSVPSSQPSVSGDKVLQALSAAPESVAENATVLDYPTKEGEAPVELKKGTNDWSCFPDFPGSPGVDPMCVDKQGMVWLSAYTTKKEPNLTQAGLAYMLQGGSDASNTDPFAEKPTEGEDWITSPSHTMVLPVGKLDQSVYSTDPKNGGPWIMWAGTPYEHLMIPVK